VPLRSHGSLSLNHALMVTGLVDRVQLTRRSCRVALAAGATCGSCSNVGSQAGRFGRYQLRSPRSFIAADSSRVSRRYGSACV
jgi:hypothetical protein